MHILIAGGSGFLGHALDTALQRAGHRVGILTRRPRPGVQADVAWNPDGTAGEWARALDGADALVNLAGAGLPDKRWTDERKQVLRWSRLLSTRSLVLAIQQVARPPGVLLSGSAVGYYGACGEEIVTEDTPPGSGFLPELCVDWEREAEQAPSATRVVLLRTGLVLDPAGGALAKMLLPFKLGVGGALGSGEQYWPWIHIADWVQLAIRLITDDRARGAFNGTAPAPVTNAEFTQAMGEVLNRPTVMKVPAIGLRAALGEMATTVLTGQRAIPARAESLGFEFRFREARPALADLLH